LFEVEKDEFVEVENNVWQELDGLGLEPGISLFLEGVKVTKTKQIAGFNLACKWNVNLGRAPKEGWFILTNLKNLELAPRCL